MRLVHVGTLVLFAACGGKSKMETSGSAGTTQMIREPERHRASSGAPCPAERGSREPGPEECDVRDCDVDAQCTDGEQGRCLRTAVACLVSCSYDECSTDLDCPDKQPCECRSSPELTTPNRCLAAGNCRVDADCGPAGFCSPSLIGAFCTCTSVDYCDKIASPCAPGTCSCGDSCGHGYYCHTPNDTCLDDRDCANGESCNFDLAHEIWSCSRCSPVP